MNRDLYTFVAHRDLPFANPMSSDTMFRAMNVMDLKHAADVVDFGAGSCELAIRLVERFAAKVAAVELSPLMAGLARSRIHTRLIERKLEGGVTVHEGDAGRFRATIPPDSYDLSVCVGSTHALGGLDRVLELLPRITRRGGLALLGEGFWKRDPSDDYLKATGMAADELPTHALIVDQATQAGLTPLWCISASEREWDEYEWAHQRALEAFAAERSADPDAAMMLDRGRAWRKSYIRWGRATMGFGLYLFRVG